MPIKPALLVGVGSGQQRKTLVVVTKKVAPKAVTRNLFKRRVRVAVKTFKKEDVRRLVVRCGSSTPLPTVKDVISGIRLYLETKRV